MLHIERFGRGQLPLVMIHGWAMHGGFFAPLIEALAEQCTLYVVDLPGHGHSRDCPLPLALAECARAIAVATPPAFWLGWSLGGQVALTAALENPHQVRALAMFCAIPRFLRAADWPHGNDAVLIQKLASDLDTNYDATLERFMALAAMGSTQAHLKLRQLRASAFARGKPTMRGLQEGLRILETTDLRAQLAQLCVPSIWIAGQRDRLVHPRAMQAAAMVARGDFSEVAHASHMPFFDHAKVVADILQPLLYGLMVAA